MRPDQSEIEQLQIEVPSAPRAIGRWTLAHELAAYRAALGPEALDRQKKLAADAKECTCGEQAKADAEAIEDGRKPRRLFGNQHKPGCNSYSRPFPKLIPRISGEEQEARYEDERRIDQLRDALNRAREEGDLDAQESS